MILVTKKQYDNMTPFGQGYAVYMQAEWPNSELKGLRNHYTKGSSEWKSWNLGNERAALHAQDSEE